jgi:hypothetical protein
VGAAAATVAGVTAVTGAMAAAGVATVKASPDS